MLDEEPISTRQLPLPPLLASIPHSLLQHHQSSLHLSTSPASVDVNTTPNPSTAFNLLQFPALKKFIDVQSSQQKPAGHLSAFSSIKSQQGNLVLSYYFKTHILFFSNVVYIYLHA